MSAPAPGPSATTCGQGTGQRFRFFICLSSTPSSALPDVLRPCARPRNRHRPHSRPHLAKLLCPQQFADGVAWASQRVVAGCACKSCVLAKRIGGGIREGLPDSLFFPACVSPATRQFRPDESRQFQFGAIGAWPWKSRPRSAASAATFFELGFSQWQLVLQLAGYLQDLVEMELRIDLAHMTPRRPREISMMDGCSASQPSRSDSWNSSPTRSLVTACFKCCGCAADCWFPVTDGFRFSDSMLRITTLAWLRLPPVYPLPILAGLNQS